MNVTNAVANNFPTDPAAYLNGPNGLQGGSSAGSTGNTDMLQQLIQMLEQMLKQLEGQGGSTPGGGAGGAPGGGAGGAPSAAGGAPGGGAGGAPSAAGGVPGGAGGAGGTPGAAGGVPGGAGGAGQMTGQSASGTLAAYMDQNGKSSLDMNDLYKLADDKSGVNGTPQAVSQAAQYMLNNPSVYHQIETHDVGGADGKSGAGNFQWAAQGGLGAAGNVPGGAAGTPAMGGGSGTPSTGTPSTGMPSTGMPSTGMPSMGTPSMGTPSMGGAGAASGAGAAGGASGLNAQSASGTLASYMDQNGKGSLDMNDMYKLAANTDGKTPQAVSQAAQYMMNNPSVYNQIETHDVGGADGKSAASNFQWAAQGGLGAAGNAPGGAGGTPAMGGGSGIPNTGTPAAGGTGTPAAGGTTVPGAAGGAGGLNAQSAAGTLASYVEQNHKGSPLDPNDKGSIDMNGLYKLAANTDGKTPQAVSQAAQYMMNNPSVFNKIETHDVAGADGNTSTQNLQWAAQGGLNG